MNNTSLTYAGIATILVGFVLDQSGYKFTTDQVQSFVEIVLAVIGGILAFIGRWRHGDITWYGKRKFKIISSTYEPID
jgi:uncharacterized membrane protein YidH (DUF202 family)